MYKYIKYNKYYRLALVCLVFALSSIFCAVTVAAVYASPATTVSLFFVPSVSGVALMMSINFWFKGKYRQFWHRLGEN